jgi:hypothetical protein
MLVGFMVAELMLKQLAAVSGAFGSVMSKWKRTQVAEIGWAFCGHRKDK